jgi:endoglucanase
MTLPAAHAREEHLRWLLELTQTPTAAGREWRVVEWIERWADQRPDLRLMRDAAGNLVVEPKRPWGDGTGPVLFTAHLDHPAFVVERVVAPGVAELSFRGGVMDAYFEDAEITIHAGGREGVPATAVPARLTGGSSPAGAPFPRYLAEIDPDRAACADRVRVGDVAVWTLPPAEVDGQGLVHTSACDDLAAAAAAIAAFDVLRSQHVGGAKTEDVRLLFTRSEEIGFTGAIAACKLGTIPAGSRVVALENSRSFADSPIGGGPIVRVGDRLSVFDPRLTAACARKAEELAGAPATPAATQRTPGREGWRWQRKLMAGGACEATVFCALGHQATCLCLPLGNYHNMADLQRVQDGTFDRAGNGPPRVAREFIHRDDYFGLVDLLVAIGTDLPAADPAVAMIDKLYAKHASVLEES